MISLVCILVLAATLATASPAAEIETSQSRIINGQLASFNQFSWHVSIQGRRNNNQSTLCGGALIGNSHVLTSATCVNGFDWRFFTIGFGSVDFNRPLVTMEVNPLAQNVRIIHPQYNPQNFANNIALLRLPIDITANYPGIARIRLPALSQANANFLNSFAHITGFGPTQHNGPFSQQLRFARTRVISQNECAQTFGSHIATVNTLCTVGEQFGQPGGPCSNDAGGPLALQEGNAWTLIGIQSFIASAGCNAALPAGYVRLGPYIQWISQVAGIPTRR